MPNVLYLMLRSNYQNTIKLPCMQVLYSSECHRSPLVHHSQDLNTETILIWQRMNEKAWRAFPSPMPIIVAEKCIKPRLKYSNHLSVIQYILDPNFNYIQAKGNLQARDASKWGHCCEIQATVRSRSS